LRPYVEFISDAWHGEDESWRLRVRLYLAPQAGDEHIDAAVIGFRATPRNGVTELVTRQYPARTVYEGGQQRGLGTGQPRAWPSASHVGRRVPNAAGWPSAVGVLRRFLRKGENMKPKLFGLLAGISLCALAGHWR